MISLREVLLNIKLIGTDLTTGRVVTLISHLGHVANLDNFDPTESEVSNLLDGLKKHLMNIGAQPATLRNEKYKLCKLLNMAENQNLLMIRRSHFVSGFSLPERPSREGPERRRYNALVRFSKFCESRKITFTAITTETFLAYRELLKDGGGKPKEALYCDLLRAWTEAEYDVQLQEVNPPRWQDSTSERYGLQFTEWPEGMKTQFEQLKNSSNLEGDQQKKWNSPLREVSLNVMRSELSRLIGYVATERKLPVVGFTLLSLLSDVDLVFDFFEWHIGKRCDGEERQYHSTWFGRFANLLAWLGGNDAVVEKYKTASKSIIPKRVRDPFPTRPLPYAEIAESAIAALVNASERWQKSKKVGRKEKIFAACEYRNAFAFALLVCRPMRSKNLREMRIGKNLIREDNGWYLFFESHEMKTSAFQCEFPSNLVSYLETYLSEVRTLLQSQDSPSYLFLTKSGNAFGGSELCKAIVQVGQRYMNIHSNPHRFRYMVGCAYILEHPNRLSEIQALLGHATIEVTLQYYVRANCQISSRRVVEQIRRNCPHLGKIDGLFSRLDSPHSS